MKIQNYIPSQAPRTLKAPQPQEAPPTETFTRGDRAFQTASRTARTLTSCNLSVSCGMTLGVGVGSLLQATLASAPLSAVVGGACGVAAAYGGFQAGATMSDWAGKLGRRLDKNQPERGEAIARGLMAGATGMTFINSGVAGMQLGVIGLNGSLAYAFDK
jgi:hypothetical protein